MSDEEALAVVRGVRPLMQQSAAHGRQELFRDDLRQGRRAVPALRRRRPSSSARGQGDDNRTTYWCPVCQT